MDKALKCPKCNSAMEEGFVPYTAGTFSAAFVLTTWVSGKPERSLLTGLEVGGRKVRAIECHRCTQCGYLESYAKKEL